MTRLAWLSRAWLPFTMVICAALLAWLAQGLVAQSPQQPSQQRRILPNLQRRPFRNLGPNKEAPKPEKPDGEKDNDEMAKDPKDGATEQGDGAKRGSGSISIIERPKTDADKDAKDDHAREPLFVGWTKPKVVLLLSGNQMGYIEPCGCSGLENQKGGLTRRMALLDELRNEKGWDVVPLDVGQHSNETRSDRQQELKLQMIADGFSKMAYQAVGLGPSDLSLSTSELSGIVVNLPVVSANVSVYERASELVPICRVVEAGGMKIGVTQIVSDNALRSVLANDIEKQKVLVGLTAAVAKLKAEKCDFQVLLAYASPDEVDELAQKFSNFNLVVHGAVHGEPDREIRVVPKTKTYKVGVGYKGMYVSAVGLFADPKAPIKYQRVPLDARFADAPAGLQLLADYQKTLESAGLEGLGAKAKPYIDGRKFVGSETCGGCHSRAYEKWQSTPHAHATESIVNPKERSGIQRHHDPECLSCHVTGWNPQEYHPYLTGYTDLKKSAHLVGNGCENCHGPGSKHVEAESNGAAAADLKKLRESMQLPLASAKKKCLECHDIDNSPEFNKDGAFEKYWEEVKHPWRD